MSSDVIRCHQRQSEVVRGTWVEHRHELEHEGVAQRPRAWIVIVEDEAQEALHAMREVMRDAIRQVMREAIREVIRQTMREAIREAIREVIREVIREAIRQATSRHQECMQ